MKETLYHLSRPQPMSQKIPLRKVKVEDALKIHQFLDDQVVAGKTYLYSIVPVTAEGVSGEVAQFVRVTFTGLTSKVELLDSASFEKPYTLTF